MTQHFRHMATLAIATIISFACAVSAFGWDTSVFAEKSKLASGLWTKVEVSNPGFHFISAQSLKQAGYSDPSKVCVFGYGARPTLRVLSKDNYVDDLPAMPTFSDDRGIWFYAAGTNDMVQNGTMIIPVENAYTNAAYYFITEHERPILETATNTAPASDGNITALGISVHSRHLMTYGESGSRLFGEDFKSKRSQDIQLELPGNVGDSVSVFIDFASSLSSEGKLDISIIGSNSAPHVLKLRTPAAATDYGRLSSSIIEVSSQGSKLGLRLSLDCNGMVNAANLGTIVANYTKALTLGEHTLAFMAGKGIYTISGANQNTILLDVTSPYDIRKVDALLTGDQLTWRVDSEEMRQYAAVNLSDKLPTPTQLTNIANQNLHGSESTPDMIIFCRKPFIETANRIARLHSSARHPLEVEIIDAENAYNEFTSGAPDLQALRRCAKMYYDRGLKSGKPLKYICLLGCATYDQRMELEANSAISDFYLPTFQSEESLKRTSSYMTDDVLGFLEDNSGSNLTTDILSVGVGRIPARTVADAEAYVDKLTDYMTQVPAGKWIGRLMIAADDGNNGIHMQQAEEFASRLLGYGPGKDFVQEKVYVDAFKLDGSVAVGAREKFHRLLKDGALWTSYVGHGSKTALTAEGLLTYSDLSNLSCKHPTILYAATCDFFQSDGASPCGAETLLFKSGGIITGIGSSRESFMTENGEMTRNLASILAQRDSDGNPRRISDIVRLAKNRVAVNGSTSASSNKLLFVTLGDPALTPAVATHNISISSVNGTVCHPDSQIVIKAAQTVTLSGQIMDVNGLAMSDFSGQMSLSLYDADRSTTSEGRDASGTQGRSVVFDEHGSLLVAASGNVTDGQFSVSFTMPGDIADNFRPSTIEMYAVGNDSIEAFGVDRNIYVYGYDEQGLRDTIPPVISYIGLNNDNFENGDATASSTLFIAQVGDDTGINLSDAGIGRMPVILLDGKTIYSIPAQYFSPSPDDSRQGTFVYPLKDLSQGSHTLTFKIYDIAGNYSDTTITFSVVNSLIPEIVEVTTENTTTSINFNIITNSPYELVYGAVEIYDLMGRKIWTGASKGDEYNTTMPLTWNLRDIGGRRVERGIYLYRAIVRNAENRASSPISGKITVSGNK